MIDKGPSFLHGMMMRWGEFCCVSGLGPSLPCAESMRLSRNSLADVTLDVTESTGNDATMEPLGVTTARVLAIVVLMETRSGSWRPE
jgi:hypothetical protein